MWRFSEEIQADLASGEPARVAAGLRDMREIVETLADERTWPSPHIELLVPFGRDVPAAVQRDLARIWACYQAFQPPLDCEDSLYRMAELATAYGDPGVACEAGMALKICADPPAMVPRVLGRLHRRGLRDEREVTGAGNYLAFLLYGEPEVREATIAALGHWRGGLLAAAVDSIRPELAAHELERLAR